ncbi:hypothetical protein Baya_16568 [Bagarius yarrelli]|uniref:Uncharacterized protein n=1 Tax=Bagarius yarrelli TaxID=175774 RepID=A0A556VW78_BAGYA|nr:hypothetical protein Baya_16568 [Bagarius yarrelli]
MRLVLVQPTNETSRVDSTVGASAAGARSTESESAPKRLGPQPAARDQQEEEEEEEEAVMRHRDLRAVRPQQQQRPHAASPSTSEKPFYTLPPPPPPPSHSARGHRKPPSATGQLQRGGARDASASSSSSQSQGAESSLAHSQRRNYTSTKASARAFGSVSPDSVGDPAWSGARLEEDPSRGTEWSKPAHRLSCSCGKEGGSLPEERQQLQQPQQTLQQGSSTDTNTHTHTHSHTHTNPFTALLLHNPPPPSSSPRSSSSSSSSSTTPQQHQPPRVPAGLPPETAAARELKDPQAARLQVQQQRLVRSSLPESCARGAPHELSAQRPCGIQQQAQQQGARAEWHRDGDTNPSAEHELQRNQGHQLYSRPARFWGWFEDRIWQQPCSRLALFSSGGKVGTPL